MARECLLRWWFAHSFRGDSPITAGVEVFQLRAARWSEAFIDVCDFLNSTIRRMGVWENQGFFHCQFTCQTDQPP